MGSAIYGYSKGDNVGEAMRPLLPPEKLMMDFAAGKTLVLAQGAHPTVTDRVAYWADRSLTGLWDDPGPGKISQPKAEPPFPPTGEGPPAPSPRPEGPAPRRYSPA